MDEDRINKEFDDFLKNRYEDHTIEPDKVLWEGINSRLYQKKIDIGLSKVRYLKVAVFSLAAIFAATIIYFGIITLNDHPKNQSINKIAKRIQPSDTENDSLLPVINTNGEKPDSIIDASTIISNQNNAVSDGIKIKKNKLTGNKIHENIVISAAQNIDTASINKVSYANTISKKEFTINNINENINITSSMVLSNSDSLNKKVFDLKAVGIRDSSTIGVNKVKGIEKIKPPKYIEPGSLKFLKPIIADLQLAIRPNIDKSDHLHIVTATEITQLSQRSDQDDLKLAGLNQNITLSGESGTSRSVSIRSPFFIEGFVSPEISYRTLVTNTQYSVPDYGKTYFNKKEKPDFTFSTGVSGGFFISDNIIFRSGIFYSRYSLKFKTEALHLLNTGPDGNLVYTSSGIVNLQLISSDSISNESLLKSSLNFSYLNIPFVAEFHFKNNYFINLGLNLNMLVGQNMNWQAENYDGNFSNANADPIDGLEPGTISMIIGFGTEKHLARKLSMILNPSLKICLSSINHTAPVKSYPYVWGMNAGLRYYFN